MQTNWSQRVWYKGLEKDCRLKKKEDRIMELISKIFRHNEID